MKTVMKLLFAIGIIICFLLLAVGLSRASEATITGTIKTSNGVKFDGTVTLYLSNPMKDSDNTVVIPDPNGKVLTVVNGTITTLNTKVTRNDTGNPKNTFYVAVYKDPLGSMVMSNNFYIDQTPFDLGTATPTSITTANVSYITPANLSGNNTWTGTNTFTQQLVSTIATGTPAFLISSTTHIVNLNAAYLFSDSANRAGTGIIRLANTDTACWRDSGNVADICIKGGNPTSSADELSIYYAGTRIGAINTTHSLMVSSVFSNTTTNSVAETVSGASPLTNIAAGSASTIGARFKIEADGVMTNTSGGAVNYTFRVRFDSLAGTLYCSTGAISVANGSTNVPWRMTCDAIIVTTGAGGTSNATCTYGVNATAGICGLTALNAIDTTVGHDILVTGQMGTASANASFSARSAVVTKLSF